MKKTKKDVSRYKRNVSATKVNAKQTAKQVNRMIRALKKRYTNVKDVSYALNNLVGKLEQVEYKNSSKLIDKRTNLIRIKNIVELKPASARAFMKAIEEFKKSESATYRGIKRIAKRQREMLLRITGEEEWVNSLSDKDLVTFHKIFDDENYEKAMEGMDSMSAYRTILMVASEDLDVETFENILATHADGDLDIGRRKAIESIYKKYLDMKK